VRLKFSRIKYDATLLAATMISVWGVIAFLALASSSELSTCRAGAEMQR
jgi:hypothetical protein